MSDSDTSSQAIDYKYFRQITRDRLLCEMLRSAKSKDSKATWKDCKEIEGIESHKGLREYPKAIMWFALNNPLHILSLVEDGLSHESKNDLVALVRNFLENGSIGTSSRSAIISLVLIMDKLTVKIMSYACKMADITDEGVSLVEDIHRRRQPLPTMDAVYFIQPTKENVVMFLSDMAGKSPLYRKAFVFFSSPIAKELVDHIKKDTTVLSRIGGLREMNLEYFAIDSQGFVTDSERALEELFGDDEGSSKGDACLNLMATRIATVLASLREFPSVRYRAAPLDPTTMTTFRDLIPTKLAAGVWNCLMKYKTTIPNFPQTETCDLLIVDRSVDQIAPIIHEWTYDAMCHDLLNMEGNKYVHEVPSKVGGLPEKKDVLLEDHDPIWLEIRHAHIADASERLHEKMTTFVSKNKAAQIHQSSRDGELSTRDLQKMVQALPQYSEQIEKLSLHVDIAGKLNRTIRETGLKELGELEQNLVFGDAGTKDVINFLKMKQDITRENKLRLLMIYAAVHPGKFDDDKVAKLMEVAKLPQDDMSAVYNMRLLEGSSENKKSSSGSFSLKFDVHKLRACHKLTTKLQREIVLGSSSLDDPPQFITKLKLLTANELSLDDLEI
nr:SNARE-interacting protein KEULE isoform X2 [Ipomoea trifida]